MKRISTGLGFAFAIGLAATLGAQAPATTASSQPTADKDHDVTVTGCLAKGTSGSFQLTNARVEPASSTTTTAGSTTTATGTTGSAAAAIPGAPMSWMVSGDNDLEKHVGHKISVTGKTAWDPSMKSSTPPPTTTTATGSTTTASQPHLDAKSIKMIAQTCP
jgi:hypothetical protein